MYLAHYLMDASTPETRAAFLGEVEAKGGEIPSRPLHPDPLGLRIVHRLQRCLGGKTFAGDLDLERRCQNVRLALALATDIAEADRAAEMMAVVARGDGADDLAVAQIASLWNSSGSGSFSLNCTSRRNNPASRFFSTASRPRKSPLPVLTAKPSPASSTWSSSVMSWPKWRNAFSMRQESSVCSPHSFSPKLGAGFFDRFEHMRRLLGRDIDLPAEFADIGDAMGARRAEADLDLLKRSERIVLRWRNRWGSPFESTSCAPGPIRHSTLSAAVTSVMTTNSSARCLRQPREVALQRCAGHDQQEGGVGKPRRVRSLSMPPRWLSICV